MWQSVETSGAAADYQSYISAYPLGKFSELARVKMLTLAQAKREAEQPSELASTEVAALDTQKQGVLANRIVPMPDTFDGDWIRT